jgi:HD-like signal output (HDOD) protein
VDAFAAPQARGDEFRAELIQRALALPVGNVAALGRVAAVCEDPDASPVEVARAAVEDEAFAALLLRQANSAANFAASRIGDVPAAVTRLGLKRVHALALGTPGLRMLQQPPDGLEWARQELHRHATCVGLVAREVAPAGVDPERALAAGLLHNLGLYVISAYAAAEFGYLLDAGSRREQFWEAEDWIFGFSHAELGASLAERWSYPLDLVVAIRDHDSPRPETALTALVQAADVLVLECGAGIEPIRPFPPLLPPGFDRERAASTAALVVSAHDGLEP